MQSVQKAAVLVATISFAIWVYAIGDYLYYFECKDPRWASVAVAMWTFIVPMFYRGDTSS